ncbi:hypothetical protein L204_104693 [Cryptococcus depauperatus]
MFTFQWDQPLLFHLPAHHQSVEFQASSQLKAAKSILARRKLELLIPLLISHVVDSASELLPSKFNLYHPLDGILFHIRMSFSSEC